MSDKMKKQFGVWLNSHHAIIIGRENEQSSDFKVLAEEFSEQHAKKTNENIEHNTERGAQLKFFKNITSHMQNVEELHLTGTGVAQEQFMHFLAETPHYKKTATELSTSNEMSKERLVEFIAQKFE